MAPPDLGNMRTSMGADHFEEPVTKTEDMIDDDSYTWSRQSTTTASDDQKTRHQQPQNTVPVLMQHGSQQVLMLAQLAAGAGSGSSNLSNQSGESPCIWVPTQGTSYQPQQQHQRQQQQEEEMKEQRLNEQQQAVDQAADILYQIWQKKAGKADTQSSADHHSKQRQQRTPPEMPAGCWSAPEKPPRPHPELKDLLSGWDVGAIGAQASARPYFAMEPQDQFCDMAKQDRLFELPTDAQRSPWAPDKADFSLAQHIAAPAPKIQAPTLHALNEAAAAYKPATNNSRRGPPGQLKLAESFWPPQQQERQPLFRPNASGQRGGKRGGQHGPVSQPRGPMQDWQQQPIAPFTWADEVCDFGGSMAEMERRDKQCRMPGQFDNNALVYFPQGPQEQPSRRRNLGMPNVTAEAMQSGALAGGDTMKAQLQALQLEDPSCVFIARRINKLGFASADLLRRHFSCYGKVKGVYVSHSRVKSVRPSTEKRALNSQWRLRAAALGFVVMERPEVTAQILAEGPDHQVCGAMVLVHTFHRRGSGDDPVDGELDSLEGANTFGSMSTMQWQSGHGSTGGTGSPRTGGAYDAGVSPASSQGLSMSPYGFAMCQPMTYITEQELHDASPAFYED